MISANYLMIDIEVVLSRATIPDAKKLPARSSRLIFEIIVRL